MKRGARYIAAGALCAAYVLALHPHVYAAQNAGVVLWNCGPGLEVWGHPGVFVEEDCNAWG